MIKLTIQFNNQSAMHIFHKEEIAIGSDPSADLRLEEESLQDIHLRIKKNNEQYYIFNEANDPYATLNGKPFRKRIVRSNDIVKIGKTTLRFEFGEGESEVKITSPVAASLEKASEKPWIDTGASLESLLEKKINPMPLDLSETPAEDFNLEDELRKMDEQAFKAEIGEANPPAYYDLDIDALVKQVEELDALPVACKTDASPAAENAGQREYGQDFTEEKQEVPLEVTESGISEAIQDPPVQENHHRTLKDYYLGDLDDESEQASAKKNPPMESPVPAWNWKLVFILLILLFLTLSIAAGVMYLNMTDRSGEEEGKAMDGVADVVMALSYAQIKHIQPQNQNWSDADFLKNNLTAVLGDGYAPSFSLASNGQFSNCPYILRIYTSSDQKQYLVIAQPSPSLFQWLIPKTAIVVDSTAMEIRKITDLKALNRLLVNPHTLEGTNAIEISNLVRQGELVPLSTLAPKPDHSGFTPPKALALLRPGAENRIYNAPRYYRFGESFMKQAVGLLDTPSGSRDVELLQNEMSALAKLPNLVLYTSQGMQWAIQAQKALSTFIPQSKFMVAYLKFNMKGSLISSHLLMDEGTADLAYEKRDAGASEEKYDIYKSADDLSAPSGAEEADASLDKHHPLFLQLMAAKMERQQMLKPYAEDIVDLVMSNTKGFIVGFEEKLKASLAEYQKVNHEADAKAAARVNELYQEYSSLPFDQIVAYMKATGFDKFSEEYEGKDLQAQQSIPNALEQQIEGALLNIQDASDLASLDKNVKEAGVLLTHETVPVPEKLIQYQNQAKSTVLKKLDEFFFSPKGNEQANTFSPENKTIIFRILKNAWVIDQDEIDYYLNEFDNLSKKSA